MLFFSNANQENWTIDLAGLEDVIRSLQGPILVTSNFDSKSPSWSEGPEDARGHYLDELIAALDLVVMNQIGVATFERRRYESVLLT